MTEFTQLIQSIFQFLLQIQVLCLEGHGYLGVQGNFLSVSIHQALILIQWKRLVVQQMQW
nr:MAG TPA: hypothetical protein [Caudoviricetes sp.]